MSILFWLKMVTNDSLGLSQSLYQEIVLLE